MHKKVSWTELQDRKWGDVIADEILKLRLKDLFKMRVFKLKPLYSFDVSLAQEHVSLLLNRDFFHTPQFYRAQVHLPPPSKRRPSKGRLEKFDEKMRKIQRNFDYAIIVRGPKPDLTNLTMEFEFPLAQLERGEVKVTDMPVKRIIEFIKGFWMKILNQKTLLEEGYDFRPTL